MSEFVLTAENYYSREANERYCSASFVKQLNDCPARAMAELSGEYVRETTVSLLMGSYVDAHFEGTLDLFKAKHPEIYKRDGSLKAEYQLADEMILRAERDPVFMSYMDGEKQKIVTGDIYGTPFKGKFDVYNGERIVDLKTTRDMLPLYREGEGRISFAEYWQYPLQMAIYQRLEGNSLPCYLAVITKQSPPDIEIIEIPQYMLDTEMELLKDKMPYIDALRQGFTEPERCGRCGWCRQTHEIKAPVSLEELSEIA